MVTKPIPKTTAATSKTPTHPTASAALTPPHIPPPPAAVPYPQSPVLSVPEAAAVLIVNILLPGVGTIVAAVIGQKKIIGRGIAQFFLTIIIVGWVWAIITGVQCMVNARGSESVMKKRMKEPT